MSSVQRFFTCDLTGDECAVVVRNGEEVCITAEEGYDILSKEENEYIESWAKTINPNQL
jgi:hypothetical protein